MKRVFTYFIVGLHVFFLCAFVFGRAVPKKKHRIAVHAAQIKPMPVLKAQEHKKSSPPAAAAVPKAKPVPATPKKKAPPQAAKPAPSKKIAPKKERPAPKVSAKLARQLEESIAKIEENPFNFKSETRSARAKSQKIRTSIALDSFETAGLQISSGEIKELLVLELKNSLHLPDFGEVTMRLVLRNDGSVASVKVMKSASKKNSEYLEKELPKHSFSFVSNLGLKDKERDFVITFCNE